MQQKIFVNPKLRDVSSLVAIGSSRSLLSLLLSQVSPRAFSSVAAPASSVGINTNDWKKNCTNTDNAFLTGVRPDFWFSGSLKPTEHEYKHGTVSLPQLTLSAVSKTDLFNYFSNCWLITDILFSALQTEEAFYRPPYHHLRHPMIFYYGHPTSLYINKLRVAGLIDSGLNPYFEEIFEVGVDEMRWDDISTETKFWPKVSEVTAYRKQVFKIVSNVIEAEFEKHKKQTGSETMEITWNDKLWALLMAIEHEKIHVETSSVLMRELPEALLLRPHSFAKLHPSLNKSDTRIANELVSIEGRTVELGKPMTHPTYGWDNEYGTQQHKVTHFQTTKYLITNEEFLQFVSDNGYHKEQYWSEHGWGWKKFRNAKWPFFWRQNGPAGSNLYKIRTVFEIVDWQKDWPAVVNFHEANAFCKWKQEKLGLDENKKVVRLPTEAEYQVLKSSKPLALQEDESILFGGKTKKRNSDLAWSSENAVDFYPPNEFGLHDVTGNVWHWLSTPFHPLPKFKIHDYYHDFSTPCFDNEHMMIMGGSFISMGDAGANKWARYHFRPHFLQHSGFRYVVADTENNTTQIFLNQENPKASEKTESVFKLVTDSTAKAVDITSAKTLSKENIYESEALLSQYLTLHFGQQNNNKFDTVKQHNGLNVESLNFPTKAAELLINYFKQTHNVTENSRKLRVLDLGCAVGGSSFRFCSEKFFDEVVGIDFSQNFINKANEISLLYDNEFAFDMKLNETQTRTIFAKLPERFLRKKAHFLVHDANELELLSKKIGKFDAVLLSNLLCRVPRPKKMINELKMITNDNAVVLFLSPYSWLEEFSNKDEWLKNEIEVEELMKQNGFEKVGEDELSLMIREHERKYQYIVSHALAFKRF